MILIIGATGTNGSELIRQLTAAGVKVRAMTRNPDKAADLGRLGVEVVAGDLDRPPTLAAAMAGCEKAFVVSSVDERFPARLANAWAAARQAGVKHVVKLSALGAADDSPAVILRMHAETDAALRVSGLAWTILCPNSFHQNLLLSAPTIREQGAFYMPLGDAKQSLIDVRDIGEVAAKALTTDGHAGQAYDLPGPESLTYSDVAPAWTADAVAEIYGHFATGAAAGVTDAVRRVTGRAPTPFSQWARHHAAAFR